MRLPWRPMPVGPAIETSLTESEANRLRELARGRIVFEVGAAYGFSTVVMGLVAEQLVSIDPHEALDSLEPYWANLIAYGLERRVQIFRAPSSEAMPNLMAKGKSAELIFVDGDHSYGGCTYDLINARRLLCPGGVIAVHDYGEETCPDVKVAVDDWREGRSLELVDTLAVLQF